MTLMRQLSDEMQSPKYAHLERERRWRVDTGALPRVEHGHHVLVEDRYIQGTRLRLRRMTRSDTGDCSLKLTKKYEGPATARPIVTAYLSEPEFALFARLPADRLVKRRYPIAHAGAEWSVDLFDSPLQGLELLETECADDEALAALKPPDWIIEEVTDDRRYDGDALARGIS